MKNKIKKIIPIKYKKLIKIGFKLITIFFWYSKSQINKLFLQTLIRKYKKIHLGCGDIYYKGFINIDKRATKATDLVQDCTNLRNIPSKQIKCVFANAFIEHLYLNQRQKFISEIYRVLNNDGKTIILSIPDFEEIAQAYLKNRYITKKIRFDLYQAYRLTHGDPEVVPDWWIEQLHKSLFDTKTLIELFRNAGFKKMIIFRSAYNKDLLPLSLGVVAFKSKVEQIDDKEKFISEIFTQHMLNFNTKTIKILFDNV